MQNQHQETIKVPLDMAQITTFCERWKITELALFGSVLRDDFRPASSDIDVLVSFAQDAHWTLWDWVEMEDDLKTLLKRDVD